MGTILFSLASGKLIDGRFGYRATATLGTLMVAAGVGVIGASTIFEVTLAGGIYVLYTLCLAIRPPD